MIILALITGFILDLVWVAAVDAVAQKRAVLAANLAVALYACSAIATILIVDKNLPACVAYAVGSWLGTYVMLKVGK